MLKDWDFAQFFPNWIPPATGTAGIAGPTGDSSTAEEKSSSSSPSSSTPPRLSHRRNESDSAINSSGSSKPSTPSSADPLFSSRVLWAGRQRITREPIPADESVSLTEFSRKASQLELRGYKAASTAADFAPGACPPPPRREKTDLLDLRRLELKKELEERRRGTLSGAGVKTAEAGKMLSQALAMTSNSNPRPPLMKSTSEPCAPLTLFRDHQQVRERDTHTEPLFLGLLLFILTLPPDDATQLATRMEISLLRARLSYTFVLSGPKDLSTTFLPIIQAA